MSRWYIIVIFTFLLFLFVPIAHGQSLNRSVQVTAYVPLSSAWEAAIKQNSEVFFIPPDVPFSETALISLTLQGIDHQPLPHEYIAIEKYSNNHRESVIETTCDALGRATVAFSVDRRLAYHFVVKDTSYDRAVIVREVDLPPQKELIGGLAYLPFLTFLRSR